MSIRSEARRLWTMIRDRTQREGESVSAVANRRAKIHRGLFSIVTAIIAGVWLGPWWASLWLAVILTYEFAALPWYLERFIEPVRKSNKEEARRRSAFITFVGASLFACGWAPAWLIGGPDAGYFAALWLSCALMQGSVYNQKDSMGFYAWTIPAVLPALIIPFFNHDTWLIPFACLLATGRILFTTHITQQDRGALFATMLEDRTKRQQAEEANRAKSQFLATMSHELRTPLNAVIGYAEILEEDLGGKAMEAEATDAARIRRAARSLLVLINEVLDFSKIEAGKLELTPVATDIPRLIEDVVATTAHLAQAHGNIVDVRIHPALKEVELDGQRLHQCALNLVSNACKFTNNGRVTISVTREADRAGAQLQIAVEDTGQGIAPADQERLFQPFVQVDGSQTRKQDGTGLGLVITRRLAQLMGGDVTMESKLGVGSRFTLRVAFADVTAATPKAEAA
jgi:signal transduction histidine kinase